MRNLFVSGRKTAPGELILKIIGMVLLLLGVMMAFGGIGAISLVTKGSGDSSVAAYLQENHMTYGQMIGGTVISCVSGIVYIISGALGVLNGGNIYKADQCLVMVVICLLRRSQLGIKTGIFQYIYLYPAFSPANMLF